MNIFVKAAQAGRRRDHAGAAMRRAISILPAACMILAITAPAAAAPEGARYRVGPISVVSTCPGQNAETVAAVGRPDYVYVAWIGCGGEGFARSTDGGRHFQKAIILPDSSQSDDPALAVAPNGTVYVSYLRYFNNHAYPVVATSFDHGKTFSRVSSLIPAVKGNWGDRDFIAAGRQGTVYVTWDYGPSTKDVNIVCSPVGSCAYTAVDATAVVQKSTDYGKTWGPITTMQPGFPAGGGYDASVLVQPSGRVDALIWGHHLNPKTFAVHPGHEFFTSSANGGTTWSKQTEVGRSAGSIAVPTWWIDGDLARDPAGNLYATWDTQAASGDIGWVSYSTNGGRTWSAPRRVTQDRDSATHIVEVIGTGRGTAVVAWQADNSPRGYATYLRPFSIRKGWLAPAIRVSRQFGNKKIWPGDTFGLSLLPASPGSPGPVRVGLSWGSAVGTSKNSEIYSTVVQLP